MEVGSIVETVGDFEELRRSYGFPYPKKGEYLTISNIEPHTTPACNKKGIVFLYFEEKPGLVGVCDKKIDGEPNFVEVLPPMEISIEAILDEAPAPEPQIVEPRVRHDRISNLYSGDGN